MSSNTNGVKASNEPAQYVESTEGRKLKETMARITGKDNYFRNTEGSSGSDYFAKRADTGWNLFGAITGFLNKILDVGSKVATGNWGGALKSLVS